MGPGMSCTEICKALPEAGDCAQDGAGKSSRPGTTTSPGQAGLREQHGKEAGWSGILFKTNFRTSVAEVSRNRGNPQARHLSACSRKQTVQPKCAGTKPRPGNAHSIGKDFHSYDHKYYFFLSFKPRHACSESQTTPGICCPPHKAGGMSPSGWKGKQHSSPSSSCRDGHHSALSRPRMSALAWALLEPNALSTRECWSASMA